VKITEFFKEEPSYIIEIPLGRVLFRTLNCEEYFKFQKVLKLHPKFKWDIEDEIWEECVLQHSLPTSRNNLPAGVVTTVARLCLYYSYPTDINGANFLLDRKREDLKEIKEQAILMVCKAFPTYVPEQLEKMNWETLTKRLAQSEALLETEFQFNSQTSQAQDDSGKIFKNLEEYVETAIDFNQINRTLHEEEYGQPVGDFNLKNLRG